MKTKCFIVVLVMVLLFSSCAWHETVGQIQEADDYQIYSKLITGGANSNSSRVRGLNVIASTTLDALPTMSRVDEQLASETGAIPSLLDSARKDFEKRYKTKVTLQNKFALSTPYRLLSPEEQRTLFEDKIKGWDNFHHKYPQAQGIRAFSQIGYNEKRTVALLYSTFSCGSRCGDGSYYVFTKKDGNWELTKMLGGVVY